MLGFVSKLTERSMPELHDHVMQIIKKTVGNSAKVLDIAAGTGVFAKRLKESGYDVSANEIDLDNWAYSELSPFPYNLNFPFSETFKVSAATPDVIIAIEVIEHLETPLGFLRECYALLNNGGLLIVTTPNINTAHGRLGFLRHGRPAYFNEHEYSTTGHITILPFWLLEMHAKSVGFKCESVDFAGKPHNDFSINAKIKRLLVNIISYFINVSLSNELTGGATVIVLRKR